MIRKNASESQDAGMEAVELKIPGSTRISGQGVFETRVFSLGKQKFCEFPKDGYTKWFDYGKIKSTVRIRTRQTGDYFAIDAKGNTQKLKSYLINQKIPAGERDKLLLAADGEHIMWIVGYRCSSGYYLDEDTKKVLEVRYKSE